MQFLRPLSAATHHQQRRLFCYTSTPINFVRDKGLDHVVFRERNLKAVLNLKNLIKSEPSKSLPLSLITQSKNALHLPTRPIEFIRKYPSVFLEFFPGNIALHPHIKLTNEVLELDAEENLVYESVEYKQDLADRLLKMLMIGRMNRISLSVFDRLKWELGLPDNFVEFIVPDFPDYFRVSGNDGMLELVCWTDELAVSAMENMWSMNRGKVEEKPEGEKKDSGRAELERRKNSGKKDERLLFSQFPLKYSSGFEMDKKYKMWVDEWQKLPYVSPYVDAMNMAPASDESDKWAVGVLHELLNIFVGNKGEKESVLFMGEYLGLRARFKRAMLQHPGIFYVSSKNRTHTVVLRDGYKRGALIKKNPLMEMRFKYLNLMNSGKEGAKETGLKQKDGYTKHKGNGEDIENVESDEEDDEEVYGSSDEETDSEEDDDDQVGYYEGNANKRGRLSNETKFSAKKNSRGDVRSSARAISSEPMSKRSPRSNRKIGYKGENYSARSRRISDVVEQGYGSERKINMSRERQFNRQQMQHAK
ncbi:hypothetical protein Leryth_001013 [Lithospermum erythrorhizon]|nr:hypothetical protein Leryth_001013 [Lithospermum erythrorhizon]